MKCKNCNCEIVKEEMFNNWLHWHYPRFDSNGKETPDGGWPTCYCGCTKPETTTETEEKKEE